MRLLLGTFTTLAFVGASSFFAAAPHAQNADECRAEFIALYTQDQGYIYPYQIEVEETMSGYTTLGATTVISPTHNILDDGWGNLSQRNGIEQSESTDDGRTWIYQEQLDPNHWRDAQQYRQVAARTATDVSCSDNVSFDGSTYRLIQGTTNYSGSELTETYYRDSNGFVAIKEVTGSLMGTDFSSVERAVAFGNNVIIPQYAR